MESLEAAGGGLVGAGSKPEPRNGHGHPKTAHNLSTSSLRKKSDRSLVSRAKWAPLQVLLGNLQEVFLGTKLFVLFPAVPLAVAAHYFDFGQTWCFVFALIGITPLAERMSFLTEQLTFYTGPTIGGMLNATCGNVTELIIALFALHQGKFDVVKYSLFGSILSNLLLVLGTSLFVGGIVNIRREQLYERKQADVNISLLLLGSLCHILPLVFRYSTSVDHTMDPLPELQLSRACSVIMLLAYCAYLFFQLKTHRTMFEDSDDEDNGDEPALGFASALAWLIVMTVVIGILSEYIVSTIEGASQSWGISVSFISVILLPIVGNAAEHAGAIIFAYKNKLDITLGVSLGSSTQISMFVFPLCIIAAWIMGVDMDLDIKMLETGSLMISILLVAFNLQDGSSHYLKGLVLVLSYIAISAAFFFLKRTKRKQLNLSNTAINSFSFLRSMYPDILQMGLQIKEITV